MIWSQKSEKYDESSEELWTLSLNLVLQRLHTDEIISFVEKEQIVMNRQLRLSDMADQTTLQPHWHWRLMAKCC